MLCKNGYADLIGLFAAERHLFDGHHFIGTHIVSLKYEKYCHTEHQNAQTNVAAFMERRVRFLSEKTLVAHLRSIRRRSFRDRSLWDRWRASQDHLCRRAQTPRSPSGFRYAHWPAWLDPEKQMEEDINFPCAFGDENLTKKYYYCIPMTKWLIVSLTLLWMKVSAKCLNINVMHACMFNSIFVFAAKSTLKGIKKFAQHRANPWALRTWATLKAFALILWCKSNSDITVWLGQCKCSVHNMYTAPPKK